MNIGGEEEKGTPLVKETNALCRADDALDYVGYIEGRDLFEGKANAITAEDWKTTYHFHRTLGLMYAFVEQWGDRDDPRSAIFQLEAAREDARRYNDARPADSSAARLRVEPRMIDYLARGYEATDDTRRAILVRLEAAETYQAEGDAESVRQVLEPVQENTLPSDLKTRYDRVLVSRDAGRDLQGRLQRDDPPPRLQIEEGRALQPAAVLVTLAGRVVIARTERTLPAVTIRNQTTGAQTTTTRDGTFSVRARPGEVLVFSYEGFLDARVAVEESRQDLTVSLVRQRR